MRKYFWFIIGILACLAVAAGAYFWATATIDSLYAYRSPLHANPPAPGQPLGQPMTQKVVIVLIDALRLDTSDNVSVMPYLNQLRSEGASATMHSRPPSFSAPGWSTLLTGAWPNLNDAQLVNPPDEYSARTFTQDNVFAAADRAGLNTAVSGYSWFEQMLANSGVDAGFYTPGEDNAADQQVVSAALPWLSSDYQLVLIHIDQVDYAGHHEGGPRDPHWNAAATRADGLLQEIVGQLDLSQDTVLVFSDHGQINQGGHGGQDPITLIEPFIAVGVGVKPGQYGNINMVDVAPTVSALLGTNIPASNQGHVLTDMLTLTPEGDLAIQQALKAQQAQLFTDYTKAIGSTATIAQGSDIVSATQAAMDAAHAKRLNNERIWRGLLALIIAAIPAVILILRRDKKVLWLLGGALVYILLFNLRYAVLDGNTYSLSSVTGQTELIVYTASTAAIAISIAWLACMLVLRAFRQGHFHAVSTTLSLLWMIIYLLTLPMLLSVALNGMLVGWTPPDYLTMFLSFLSIIQSLMVAVIGLLLTGISALIGKISSRKSL